MKRFFLVLAVSFVFTSNLFAQSIDSARIPVADEGLSFTLDSNSMAGAPIGADESEDFDEGDDKNQVFGFTSTFASDLDSSAQTVANCSGLIIIPEGFEGDVAETTFASNNIVVANSPVAPLAQWASATNILNLESVSTYEVQGLPFQKSSTPDTTFTLHSELRLQGTGGPSSTLGSSFDEPIHRVAVGGSWCEVFHLGFGVFRIEGVKQQQTEQNPNAQPETIFHFAFGGYNEIWINSEVVEENETYQIEGFQRPDTGAFRATNTLPTNPGFTQGIWGFSALGAGWVVNED